MSEATWVGREVPPAVREREREREREEGRGINMHPQVCWKIDARVLF